VVSELHKNYTHRGETPRLYFWRSSDGHEVDVIVERGETLIPVEIKSRQTLASDAFNGLHYRSKLAGPKSGQGALIYGGRNATGAKASLSTRGLPCEPSPSPGRSC